MKKTLFSYLGYALVFVLIYTAINWYRSPAMPNAPALYYTAANGEQIDGMAQSHHQPVLLYFWGTWCAVCQFSTPKVQALHDDGVSVITVAVKSDSTADLAKYTQAHGYSFVIINDLDGAVFTAWQAKVTPSFVIIKDGKISQSFTGIAPLWLLKFRLWIVDLIG